MPKKRISHVEYTLTPDEVRSMLQTVLGSDTPDNISEVNLYVEEDTWCGSVPEDQATDEQLDDQSNWTRGWVLAVS